MLVGSFGDITFGVSDSQILTFDDFSRKSQANYSEHKVINNPEVLEFLGRSLETITFTVLLMREFGIDDLLMQAHAFREKLWNGEAEFLVIGNHLYTENKMVITDMSEAVKVFDATGHHLLTKIDVTFKEYREYLE